MSSGVWAMEKRIFSGSPVHPAANEKLPIPDILRKVRRFMARQYPYGISKIDRPIRKTKIRKDSIVTNP